MEKVADDVAKDGEDTASLGATANEDLAAVEDAEIVEETTTPDEAAAPEASPSPEAEVIPPDAEAEQDSDASEASMDEAVPSSTSEPQVIVKRAGGGAMLLGGVAAAVLGFVVAQIVPDGWPVTANSDVTDELAAADADLASRLGALEEGLGGVPPQLEDVAGLAIDVEGQVGAVAATVASLEERLAALEARPRVDLSSLDNSAAFEAELEALRGEIAAVSAEANAQIEAARNEATLLEQNAAAAAEAAARRAALSRVLAALDSGVPYAATLDEFAALTEAEIPDALRAPAADGVPTLASLQADFPPLARDALAEMRRGGGDTGVGGFLRTQFGVRSLEPQEGASPDAVLSRIEDAVRGGRLSDALAEAATLPEAGQAILAPWVSAAETRQAAFSAANDLTRAVTQPDASN
ncbi:MAG: hypothetical protein AAFO93_07630 [Pseudomonadota bacterium]